MGLVLIGLDGDGTPDPVAFHISVYDKADVEIGKYVVNAIQGETPFVGILTKDPAVTIGRVDIWDVNNKAEGISAISLYSQPAPPCPAPGDCCTIHANPGGENDVCCNLVCAIDPLCCEAAWDSLCVNEALQLLECACPPGAD
jgi:hypothetical protein